MNILNTIIQKPNTNLYQAKLQNNNQEKKQNVFAPIATTSLIKPDRPQNSYIINDPLYMLPINFVTDIKENAVNIVKATTGKSNDHDLGRINDFSMKAGALALAGYLFTQGKTSLTKSMEFVGFASFFASMALWPKLFIQTPLKAMYGLDIHQKYMDNEGRKKMFFQDPQYIPWDLYTDEQLSQLGDRLGVPRDIHNRNEVIKKKAHKIALQGNTLWMLTAGFATPLMCALMCNGFEKIVTPRSERSTFPNNIFGAFASSIEKMRIDNAENNLKKMTATAGAKAAKLEQSQLSSFLRLHIGEELTTDIINNIQKRLHNSDDVLEPEVIRNQIKALISTIRTIPETSNTYIQTIWEKIAEHRFENTEIQKGWRDLISLDTLKSLSIEDGKQIPVENFMDKLSTYIYENSKNTDMEDYFAQSIDEIIENVNNALLKKNLEQGKITQYVESKPITEEFIQKILRLDRNIYENTLRLDALNKYQMLYLGDVGDSIATNRWQNVSKAFFEILNYTKSEIKTAKTSGATSLALLQKKLEEIAADDRQYDIAVKKIQRAILDYDELFIPDTEDGSPQGIKKIITNLINEYSEKVSTMFKDGGFDVMSERIIGNNETTQGSLKANLMDRMTSRIEGLRNGMYKLLHTLDFFKRTSGIVAGANSNDSSEFVQIYKHFNFTPYTQFKPQYSEEQLLKDIQEYKKIVLNATIADHTTKFNMTDAQRGVYVRFMTLIYDDNLAPETKKALGILENGLDGHKLGETNFITSFTNKIRETRFHLGNFQYPHAQDVVINKTNQEQIGHALYRDSLLGKKVSDFSREAASSAFNSSKWLGKFGTMAAVLVGVTLLSQVFFGKISKQDIEYIRKDKA